MQESPRAAKLPANLRVSGTALPQERALDNLHISAYSSDMRRKPGHLLPIEIDILVAAIHLSSGGTPMFHGFMIAKEIRDRKDARLLTAHGTLYRALARLEKQGHLASQWEDPALAAAENRPRRKLYELTAVGAAAAQAASADMFRNSTPLATSWAITT